MLPAGTNQTLSVTFTPDDTADYLPVTTTATINVQMASPVITWSNPASITYGTALDATQSDASTTIPGTFVYSPALGTVLPAGTNRTWSLHPTIHPIISPSPPPQPSTFRWPRP